MNLERIGKKGIKQGTYFSQTSKNARILPTRVLTAVVWILLEVFTASARLGVWPWIPREGSVSVSYPDKQGSWGQRGAHLGPTGPRRAPCWPHELWYLGSQVQRGLVVTSVLKTKMICHTRDLWKLARRRKQIRLLCLPEPWRYYLSGFQSSQVRQYLANIIC